MKKNILIIDTYADRYRRPLEKRFPDVVFHTAAASAKAEDIIRETNILVAFPNGMKESFLRKARKLEWIQSLISGTDHILALKSLNKNVVVTSARGIHGPQVSEMVFLHMLNLTRGYLKMLRDQDQAVWERRPQSLLHGKTAGILGVGVIAEELARKCKAFNMTVYGISATERKVAGIDRFYPREALGEVAALLDYLILLVPYSSKTDKIVDAKVISSMKPSAYLINVARGGVLDEQALIEALKEHKIAGAGLDVFQEEPLPKDHPFWKMKNVMITPKVSGMSDIYPEQVLPILETNLRHFLSGNQKNMVNVVVRPDR